MSRTRKSFVTLKNYVLNTTNEMILNHKENQLPIVSTMVSSKVAPVSSLYQFLKVNKNLVQALRFYFFTLVLPCTSFCTIQRQEVKVRKGKTAGVPICNNQPARKNFFFETFSAKTKKFFFSTHLVER
jgi:hypothetical protein